MDSKRNAFFVAHHYITLLTIETCVVW